MERSDFPLRNDIKHVLLEHSISDSMLIFRSDIDLHHLHAEKKLSLSLVDFHILPKADESLEDVVTEIIDHRKQEKEFNKRWDACFSFNEWKYRRCFTNASLHKAYHKETHAASLINYTLDHTYSLFICSDIQISCCFDHYEHMGILL